MPSSHDQPTSTRRMLTLHILLIQHNGTCHLGGQAQPVCGPALALIASQAELVPGDGNERYSFTPARLQPVYRDLRHLLGNDTARAEFDTLHTLPIDAKMVQAVRKMAEADAEAMLHFVCAYGLTVDTARVGTLLHQLAAADLAFFEMMERDALKPWPAVRYAEMLGLSLRKLNYLFLEKFGISAKQWLLARRLEHASTLLQTSTKKIIDISLESGFCSPAHFADSFRRHFHMSPTDVRRLGDLARPIYSL